jgi:hypothetical protein
VRVGGRPVPVRARSVRLGGLPPRLLGRSLPPGGRSVRRVDRLSVRLGGPPPRLPGRALPSGVRSVRRVERLSVARVGRRSPVRLGRRSLGRPSLADAPRPRPPAVRSGPAERGGDAGRPARVEPAAGRRSPAVGRRGRSPPSEPRRVGAPLGPGRPAGRGRRSGLGPPGRSSRPRPVGRPADRSPDDDDRRWPSPGRARRSGRSAMAEDATGERGRKRRTPPTAVGGVHREKSGGVLLSQGVYPQVPSALAGLTAVFGMGTGVTPPL